MSGVYRTSPQLLARAIIVAVAVAVPIAILWSYQPDWSFWFAIGCGFGIAEGTVRVTGAKRGSTYQMIGMAGVLLSVILCRVLLAHRLGISFGDIGNVLSNSRVGSQQSRLLFLLLALDLPNIVYIGLALAIPFFRFR